MTATPSATFPILTVTLNAAIDTTLTVPTLEAGASYTAREVLKLPGGKGLNVARALAGLDVPVRATGLSGGPPAAFIAAGLEAEGIDARFMPIAGTTRTCTAIVEVERHRATEVNERGPEISPHEARLFMDHFAALAAEAAVVVLSGSLPSGLPDDYYATLIAAAHATDTPAVLDTSGRALGPGLEAMPFLVKPNAREAAAVIGVEVHGVEDAVRAGQLLRQRGARMALVTLGAAGAVLVHEAGAWFAHTDHLQPLSTVGCGDSFVAGFIAALSSAVRAGEGATIDEVAGREDVAVRALILGAACGAANALMLGAGRMARNDVTRLQRTVTVRSVV